MEFRQIIRERYSCRKFSGTQIAASALSEILEAGRLAPTAKNLQEQRIYVIQSDDGLHRIDELTPCRYGAPTVIAVAFRMDDVFVYPGGKRDSGAEDAAIAATHMMLAAADQGVDSCWINFFDPEHAGTLLGLPENEEVLMLLDLGYAESSPERIIKNRKELARIVSYM